MSGVPNEKNILILKMFYHLQILLCCLGIQQIILNHYHENALNNVIIEATGGHLDNKFEVDWEKYRNCILVTNTEGVKKIYTRVFDVIDLTK